MNKYKVICVDMFQTLVDVESRKQVIWERILKSDYTDALCKEYAGLVGKHIITRFHEEMSQLGEFRNLRSIFEGCFEDLFQSTSVDYDPKEAAQIFIEEHNHATWYFDSADFLKRAKETYAVCLVSDADRDMVEGLIQDLPIDILVISEEVGSYKHNSNGKMFTTVIEHFGCRAQDILHIGDSSSDIEGAGQLNIDTCWLNRRKVSKRFSISPTYEVASLCDLFSGDIL